MSCRTVASAAIHGRAHVRALVVQASLERHPTVSVVSQPRRRHKQLGFVATEHQAAAASCRVPVAGAASLYADATSAANSLSSSLGSWLQETAAAASRSSLRHRTLTCSLLMMSRRALAVYATLADAADAEIMLPLDPRWLGQYRELLEFAKHKGGSLTNKDVRGWLTDHPRLLDEMGIDPVGWTQRYDIDHTLPVGAKNPGSTDRSDHPMNLFIMDKSFNRSCGVYLTPRKLQHVGLRVWCAVLCWHVLRDVLSTPLQEAVWFTQEIAACPSELLDRAKQGNAVAASAQL